MSDLQSDDLHSENATPGEAPYAPPAFEVIPLDCEITAYAPDGDQPLF